LRADVAARQSNNRPNLPSPDCAAAAGENYLAQTGENYSGIDTQLALYIGGMGARSKNYYNNLARRFGYEAAATEIQDHYLAGRRKEAEAAVPDALIDETSLVGPKERVRDRLEAWKELAKDHRVGSLLLAGAMPEALRAIAEAVS
ncbi:MAG: LLM class flavin-dependent oxidoreductase, partial [Stellaceae bacterium]